MVSWLVGISRFGGVEAPSYAVVLPRHLLSWWWSVDLWMVVPVASVVLDLGSLVLPSDLLRSAGFLVKDSSLMHRWIWSCFGFFLGYVCLCVLYCCFLCCFLFFCVSVLADQRLWVTSDVKVVRFHKPERVWCSGSITRKGCSIINPKGSVTNVLDSSLDLSSYAFRSKEYLCLLLCPGNCWHLDFAPCWRSIHSLNLNLNCSMRMFTSHIFL